MQPTLLILAAGIGSRYGGIKQADSFGPSGESILEYSVFDAARAGFGKIVFVIRKSIEEQLKKTIINKIKLNIPLEFVYQEFSNVPKGIIIPSEREKPLGTGHAVLVAGEKIHEPFAVINADDFYGFNAFKLTASFLKEISQINEYQTYCLIGYKISNTLSEHGFVARGLCQVDKNRCLTGIEEHTRIQIEGKQIVSVLSENKKIILSGNEIVSMNMMGFSNHSFQYFEQQFEEFINKNKNDLKAEFYLPSVVNYAIQTGKAKVKVIDCPDKWFGVTYKEDKDSVIKSIKKLIDEGIYPKKLW